MLIPFQDKGADANTKLNCGFVLVGLGQPRKEKTQLNNIHFKNWNHAYTILT